MATVNGLTAERMLEIEAASIVDGDVVAGNLILSKHDGSQINAGSVIGPTGSTGAAGPGVPTGGSTGQVLKKNSGTNYDTVWGTLNSVNFATSFPGSPADGDEAILVDSTTAPTYAWRFRYVSGISDAYKWLFIGGSPLTVEVLTNETSTTVTTYVDLTTTVSITTPRAGIYDIRHGAAIYDPVNDSFVHASIKIGAAAVSNNEAALLRARAGDMVSVSRYIRRTLAASDVIKQMYSQASAGTMQLEKRWIEMIPLRVS